MEYIHINEKDVSRKDKQRGDMITVGGKKRRVIGFELATGNFIVEVGKYMEYK